MAKMNGRNRFSYDAVTALRAYDQVDVTAATNTSVFDLEKVTAYWGGYNSDDTTVVVIEVKSLDRTTGDETYKFQIELADNAGFTGSVKAFDLNVTAPGIYVVELYSETVAALHATADRFRVALTTGGTTPIINFAAYVAPDVD